MATKPNDQAAQADFDLNLDEIEVQPILPAASAPESPAKEFDLISVRKEDTRGRLAIFFLLGFFFLLFAGMVLAAWDSTDKLTSIKEVALTLSGILSGPLGFVIGYYFRSSEDN